MRRAGDGQPPRLGRLGSEQEVRDFLEAAADQAGEPEDFSLLHVEGHVLDQASAHALDRDVLASSCRVGMVVRLEGLQTPADDQLDQLRLLGLRADDRALDAPVPKHGHPVGHGQRFVEVVRHEEHTRPVRHTPAHDFEQAVPLGPRQEHGGFVQDQQAAARVVTLDVRVQLVEGPHDGDQRALHGGKVGDIGPGFDVQAETRKGLRGPLAFFAPVDLPLRGRRELPGAEVLHDGQVGQEAKILMHEAHAELRGRPDLHRQLHRLSVDLQFAARVRVVVAAEDLDERRLATPVLADKAVDLPTPDAHADFVQRTLPAERHRHIAHDDGVLIHGLVSRIR